jgi:5'-methylthioadenosine phosphorylase
MKIGIISGHLLPGLMQRPESVSVETPYGPVMVRIGSLKGHSIFFVSRHGEDGSVPPHRLNARAMIAALAESHVDAVISVGTVGSLKKGIGPGAFVVPHDFIDMTRSRPVTFFDECRVHVDMSEPFCPVVRKTLLGACRAEVGVRVYGRGVCLVTEGPRLETAAEIRMFAPYADVVGMTLVPEVVLAREKGLCFASVLLVCNMAAGLQDRLTATEIVDVVKKQRPLVSSILRRTVEGLPASFSCGCVESLNQARL